MQIKKRILSIALTLALSITCLMPATQSTYAASLSIVRAGQTVTYTGKTITNVSYNNSAYNLSSTPALVLDGYVMVPYYQALVANGPKLTKSYDSANGILTLKNEKTNVKFYVNQKYAYVNGVKKSLSVAPCFVTYKTSGETALMVPAKPLSQYFDFSYTYTSSVPKIEFKSTKATTSNDSVSSDDAKSDDISTPDSNNYVSYTTPTSTNVRKGPSTSQATVAKLSRNTSVNCYGTSGNFTKVKYNGDYRYISTSCLNESKVYYRYVNKNSVNVKKTASASSTTVATHKIGTKLLCYGTSGSYTKIKYNGNYRYVSTSYLTSSAPIQATSFNGLTTSQFIAKVGPIAQANYKESGVLASVTLAQAILESGWGKSELAQKANNMFGMKTSLSGNTWSGSVWKGDVYTKRTAEYTSSNKKYYITANFRKYNSVASSIADHSAYLTGAMNGSKKRYAGLTSTTSYTKQLTIIKNGGYATSPNYAKDLGAIIQRYGLTKYDKK